MSSEISHFVAYSIQPIVMFLQHSLKFSLYYSKNPSHVLLFNMCHIYCVEILRCVFTFGRVLRLLLAVA